MTRSSDRIPILLDTDIGSDVDDAVALAYLLCRPDCDLLGITTVTGAVERRAACARAVCVDIGQPEIPIVCGARNPLLFGPGQPEVPHYLAIAGRQSEQFPDGGVEFLRQTIRRNPGEIVLLSIGPFTNIALLFALDPEIPALLRSWVCMGGSFPVASSPDWNAAVDPAATAIAYARGPAGHLSIGLDVTSRCRISARDARAAFASIPSLSAMTDTWLSTAAHVTLHDPLAAAAIFEPGLCRYADGEVTVSLEPANAGATAFREGGSQRHRIAVGVDEKAAVVEILETIRAVGLA